MSLLSALSQVAALFTEKAKSKIVEVNAPKAIADSFTTDSPKEEGGVSSISVHIHHPAAAAYEWGSGIHAERGKAEKYPIPKDATGVSFPKEKWKNYNPSYYDPPRSAPDVFVFDQVMHPGVKKRPFIHPTLEENKKEIARLIFGGVKTELLLKNEKSDVMEVVETIE